MDTALIKAMVIGDGSLDSSRKGYRNTRFCCTHSIKQKSYLLWKRKLLERAGLKTWYSEFMNTTNPHTGKTALMCKIESRSTEELTVLKNLMYPKHEGFKRGVLTDLNDLHLAIIFMDDGTKMVNKTVGVTHHGIRYSYPCVPYIAQFRFSLQSHGEIGSVQFCNWLKRRFNIEARVFHQGNAPIVSIAKNAHKDRFRRIVSKFIHPSLFYKIDGIFQAVSISP